MSKIPNHIALILDGNRRWARKNGLEVLKGHRTGAEGVEALLDRLDEHGVKTVTLWVFSTENWKRDSFQVNGLMSLFEEFLDRYRERAMRDQIRVVHLGRKDRLPESLRDKLSTIEEETRHFDRRIINIALDYGGHDEILRAVKRIQDSGVAADSLTEEAFNNYLDTANQPHPYPDIIVRTGGDMRMSGFMPWQSAYSEYYFLNKYLPELKPDDIDTIIDSFNGRERRFGGGK